MASDIIYRAAFMTITDNAVKTVCIKKVSATTEVLPYNQNKIDLHQFHSSLAGTDQSGSPIKATCSSCRLQDVELYPVVKLISYLSTLHMFVHILYHHQNQKVNVRL